MVITPLRGSGDDVDFARTHQCSNDDADVSTSAVAGAASAGAGGGSGCVCVLL